VFYEESPHDPRGDEELLEWWCALPGAERLSVLPELVGGRAPRLRRALLSQPKRSGLLPMTIELLRAPTEPSRRRL
jgi:hypothetical protein